MTKHQHQGQPAHVPRTLTDLIPGGFYSAAIGGRRYTAAAQLPGVSLRHHAEALPSKPTSPPAVNLLERIARKLARYWREGRDAALRAEMAAALEALRSEVHAFAGSLHADSVARIEALRETVETDLSALLRFRQSPDSELESLLTDSMKAIVDRATAQLQSVLLDRSELSARVLEQELVRVGAQLRSRLDELEARCGPTANAEPGRAARPPGATASPG